MSKNKENRPLAAQQRANGRRVSSSDTGFNPEFFTDSILESSPSHIPTPSPQKHSLTKSRRARRNNKSLSIVSQNKQQNSVTLSANLKPSPTVRTKSRSPLRRHSLSTPPGSRDGFPLPSPYSDVTSPPPKELPSVYQQIADEEDLAETERDDSDPNVPDDEDEFFHQVLPRPSLRRRGSFDVVRFTSRASTPTQPLRRFQDEDYFGGQTETMSEPTGLSFANQLSDPALRAVITPHLSESAKDRARLHEVWRNQKPVAFPKADRTRAHNTLSEFAPPLPAPRVEAFSRSSRPKLRPLAVGDTCSDPADRPESQSSGSSTENHAAYHDIWHTDDQPPKPLPINSRAHRNFHYSWSHGFPIRREALAEQTEDYQNRGGRSSHTDALMSQDTRPSSDIVRQQPQQPNGTIEPEHDFFRGRDPPPVTNSAVQHDVQSTRLNWPEKGTDVAFKSSKSPSVAPTKLQRVEDATSSTRAGGSPERTKKWDVDFTGQSFQVSESPPVRSRVSPHVQRVVREIKDLAKQAVTTNRLGEMRERHSQESLRRTPSSGQIRPIQTITDDEKRSLKLEKTQSSELDRGRISLTPASITRSLSNGSTEKGKFDQSRDPSDSYDFLQRFARAMSNTPKSTPPSTITTQVVKPNGIETPAEVLGTSTNKTSDGSVPEAPRTASLHNAQTPKVTGGWTDTVLPDTAKTAKPAVYKGYAQTPHVSAGGWIDTPAPADSQGIAPGMTPIAEEDVPEELVSGIAKDRIQGHPIEGEVIASTPVFAAESKQVARTFGLVGILDRARERIASQDITSASREDTLNLGNDTIESLQGLLDLDDADITTLSKMDFDDATKDVSQIHAEAQLLDRLAGKLERLQSNIHDARRGISKLEHQVSSEKFNGASFEILTDRLFLPPRHSYVKSSVIPAVWVALVLPIPLLLHPRNNESALRSRFGFLQRRPTLLGWLVIVGWTWYLLECTFIELYSHPTHASRYTWPPIDQPEPEWPFVLPTMLLRWTRLSFLRTVILSIFQSISTIIVAIWRMISMWASWSDGFVADEKTKADILKNAAKSSAVATLNRLAESAGIDLSMMNDEYI